MRPSTSPARRRLLALAGGAVLALSAATVWADHTGSPYINLTDDNVIITHDGAVYAQGGVGSGTGNFDPFLTLSESSQSPSSQAGTQDGYNQCDDAGCPDERGDAPFFYDQFFGGGRTHEILVSAIPTLEYEGALYREFSLDANDEGNDTWMSVDEIKLFVDSQVNLTSYDNATETFGNDTGDVADKVFDMDAGAQGDQTILVVSQGLESGSGVSDITVLVPNDAFPAECAYGSTDCDLYLYFWTSMGHAPDGNHAGVTCTQDPCDWDVSAGFEEWRVRFLPVVNVEKTATETFSRDYDWTVNKTVAPDTLDLFDGQSDDVTWSVTATRDAGTDGAFKVSGTITITNPTGASPIPKAIPAEILSVEDVLTLDGSDIPLDPSAIDCGVTFPFTLNAQDSLVCTYEVDTPSATAASTGENTATVTIDSGIPAGDGGIEFSDEVPYEGTAAVDFSGATPTEVDATATLTDDRGPLDQAAVSGVAETYDETFTCGTDEGQHDNTARVTEDDSGDFDEATASVTVNCYQLSVEKDAQTAFTRTFPWDITKSADVEEINLFAGDDATINWDITATVGTAVDTGFGVSGTITVSNPAPIAATGVVVTDQVSGVATAATVDCDAATSGNQSTVDIPAMSSVDCTYILGLSDDATRTNTATATLAGVGYTGTAAVDFADATITEIDECITVTDDNATPDDTGDDTTLDANLCADESPGEYDLSTTVGPFSVETCDSVTVTNTARTVTNDTQTPDSASDSVDVHCFELTVEKDAQTSFDRNYDWTIAKERVFASGEDDGDGDPTTLTLAPDQTYTLTYEIQVGLAATPFNDSNWGVGGTITVTNPAPIAADDVAVTDAISGYGPADHLDCDPVTAGEQTTVDILAASSVDCVYSAALPDGDDRTNTATATLFGIGYTDDADVDFSTAEITEIDECITVVDDNGTPLNAGDDVTLGTVCADDDLSQPFTHTIDVGPFAACGEFELTNTASFTTVDDENDTDESGSSSFTVNIEVPCPEGCTLTQGYWKTHNDSFWGGAPTDETWELIGPLAEQEPFYLSGLSYFDAMWTAPKGNAYFNLASQYIAAQLNMLAGADGSDIASAFAAATDLFQTYTDEDIAQLKGKNGKELRSQFIELAGILASYNEGLIGPGHCDEDGSSSEGADTASVTIDRRNAMNLA